MVPAECLRLKHRNDNDGENCQRDGLLNDFQLNKVERTTIDGGADAVSGNHKGILEKGDAPRDQNDENQRPVLE